ncbi:MAG: hypothetical protein K0B02_04280 [DPANN group archaeon]|nr:hypothetical protein [DPANN group archaeon]
MIELESGVTKKLTEQITHKYSDDFKEIMEDIDKYNKFNTIKTQSIYKKIEAINLKRFTKDILKFKIIREETYF